MSVVLSFRPPAPTPAQACALGAPARRGGKPSLQRRVSPIRGRPRLSPAHRPGDARRPTGRGAMREGLNPRCRERRGSSATFVGLCA